MKIMITGGHGRLGKAFADYLREEEVYSFHRYQLDCTDRNAVMKQVDKLNPDLIFHCAAFTNVDECESQPMKSFLVNCVAVQYMAEAAGGRPLFLFSTDYLFSKFSLEPYSEMDQPTPDNMYALSKWLAEEGVRHHSNVYVIRTSWLFGGENDFIEKIRTAANLKSELKVVSDQVGSPTYIRDLVEWTWLLRHYSPGLYHISNRGACSRFEWAQAILSYLPRQVNLVSTKTEKRVGQASRPTRTVLSTTKLEQTLLMKPRRWQEALGEYMQEKHT
ncbi:SDR family oxidoreductase [Alkalicoccobacillus murimartini]|uniref:dTDP-4-dehydrorhamnose reductase n=1 Tax=Alkalicoccobacillus murimartini TaxID=171685 RepID=A0ABT9YJ33_9BACI|nr:NAD(P)-dependent oxidoreductase [Alkalicoccobacillus murimartini]MDQ0207875.1 dTDP-4-dehydrorhamnose reductase [Alkalicoccobacillus murimartini]